MAGQGAYSVESLLIGRQLTRYKWPNAGSVPATPRTTIGMTQISLRKLRAGTMDLVTPMASSPVCVGMALTSTCEASLLTFLGDALAANMHGDIPQRSEF